MFLKNKNTELQIISKKILNKINGTSETFEEVGIINGLEIIIEFIEYNETGLAFEHLIYVIESSNYKTTRQEKENIIKIGKIIGIEIN